MVSKLGAVMRLQNLGFVRRVVITTENTRFSQILRRGSKVYVRAERKVVSAVQDPVRERSGDR
jgi:hypothetical protein